MDYVSQLRSLALRLERTNSALRIWDEIDAQKHMPPAERKPITRPVLSRRALKTELIMLLADMSRVEQEIGAAGHVSEN